MPSLEGISAIQIEHLELLTKMQFLVNKVIIPLRTFARNFFNIDFFLKL